MINIEDYFNKMKREDFFKFILRIGIRALMTYIFTDILFLPLDDAKEKISKYKKVMNAVDCFLDWIFPIIMREINIVSWIEQREKYFGGV